MQIAGIKIAAGAALAPMAGISDNAMRRMCEQYGAIFTVSEMVSAQALCMGDKKSLALLRKGASLCTGTVQAQNTAACTAPPTKGAQATASGQAGSAATGPIPYAVQLFGSSPSVLAQAVQCIQGEDFDFLDLNMGCPAPKICGHGSGSALLKNPCLAGQLAAAAVQASTRPVSVKMRIGWDDTCMTGLEVALRCEQAGVGLLVVHARTRQQQYSPGVNLEAVAKIKAAVSIPVICNGDINSAAAALHALRQTHCDAVMLGRAALGNPFLFTQVNAAICGQPPPPAPTLRQRLATMEQQVRTMCEEKGEQQAMPPARKIAAAYMAGLNGAASLRHAAHSLSYFKDLAQLIQMAYTYNLGGNVAGPHNRQALPAF